jgi:predicted aspartyl protease
MGYRFVMVFNLVWVCLLGCRAENAVSTRVRCRILQKAMVAVPVFINGRGPFEFLLDTGTETSLIEPSLARDLALSATDQFTLYTPNGEKTLARAFLPTVTLGTVSGSNVEVLVDRPEAITALDPKLRGILGQNFLSQFNLLLDYKQQRVTLFAGPSPDEAIAGTHIPFLLDHGRPLLIAKGSNGADLHLLLDSGSSSLWLFTREAPGFLSDPAGRNATLQTAAKATSAIRGMVPLLSLGDTRLRDVPALLIEQQTHESSVDGLLPTSLFHSVYFNNREEYAIINRSPQ